jgi:N-acetylneuraminic acid mutarotase
MRAHLPRLVVVALVAISTVACGGQVRGSTPASSLGASCPSSGPVPSVGCWQQILPPGSGGFPAAPDSRDTPRWRPGLYPLTLKPHLAFADTLWMIGQTRAYSSPDGLTWTEHEKTDWGERIYEATVYFKGRLWTYGGLAYQSRTFLNDIWSSSDGVAWTNLGTAAWPARGGHTVVVYQDRLWLFGGANHIASDRSTDGFLNDVWVSDDGVDWTPVTEAASWSPRDKPGVVVFNDQLYLLGGQNTADVWRSSNGRDWSRLMTEADWRPRHDAARIVFGGTLWVFGGWIDRSTNAVNDVWYSRDGLSWQRQADHAPWAPRGPAATVVFHDRIWMYSGKHTGFDDNWGGDLWQMTAPARTTN